MLTEVQISMQEWLCRKDLFKGERINAGNCRGAQRKFACEDCAHRENEDCEGPVPAGGTAEAPRGLTEDCVNLCVKLYALGVPVKLLAEACEKRCDRIRIILKESGAAMRSRSEGYAAAREFYGDNEKSRDIAKLYAAGVPPLILKKVYGLPEGTLAYKLKINDVRPRGRGEAIGMANAWKRRAARGLDVTGAGGERNSAA